MNMDTTHMLQTLSTSKLNESAKCCIVLAMGKKM